MSKELGVFISDEILKDKALTLWERVIYSMILNLHNNKGECRAKQSYFCKRLGVDKGNFSKHLKNLISKGYVKKGDKRGILIPAQKVVKTTTNPNNEKLLKQQLKVVTTTTQHHIVYNIKDIKENNPKKIITDQEKNKPLEIPNLEKQPPAPAAPPLDDLPLWQQAARAFVDWYGADESQREYIYATTHIKTFEALKNIIVACCGYYCENDYKMKQVIKNPGRLSGMVVKWISTDKQYKRNKPAKKNGGADLSDDFINNLNNQINNLNL
jgi:hypothetical protein